MSLCCMVKTRLARFSLSRRSIGANIKPINGKKTDSLSQTQQAPITIKHVCSDKN